MSTEAELLVLGADRVRPEHVRVLGQEFSVEHSADPAELPDSDTLARYDAIVIDRSGVDDAVVRRLHRTTPESVDARPALVAAGSRPPELPVDELVRRPVEGCSLANAVRRAIRLRAYESAVDDLFAVCSPERRDGPDAFGPARERADERLAALDACEGRFPFDRLIDV